MVNQFSRREFLERGAGAALAVAWHLNPSAAAESKSPNEKLNIAAVGTMNRAGANIAGTSSENIVAFCDVDENLLGKAAEMYPQARQYRGFRGMLEGGADKSEAVLVGPPPH